MADAPDLFGVRRKATTKPKAVDPYPGETHRLLKLYISLYEARFNEKPLVEAKDGGILKRLVNLYAPAKVEERLRFFMTWRDPFVESAGYTVPVFSSQWNKITAVQAKLKAVSGGNGLAACGHKPACTSSAEHSRRLINDMRGKDSPF